MEFDQEKLNRFNISAIRAYRGSTNQLLNDIH